MDFEHQARRRKAESIAEVLVAHLTKSEPGLARIPQQARNQVASHAGVNEPSEQTWLLAVELFEAKVAQTEAARAAIGEPTLRLIAGES